ncbi:MAG: hypothetical protein R3F43_33035, partial [bacterium]
DAAIKLQIIELLRTLKDEKLTYLLISHDLGLVRRIADRVLVMLSGRIIEEVPADRLGGPAHHPYTGRLMRAAHLLDDREKVAGREPQANAGGAGCVYAADCPLARELGIHARCQTERPPFVELAAGHRVACFASQADEAGRRMEDA